MIGSNSNGQLRAIVERVERLNEEEAQLKADKRDIFAEAKALGYDPKVLRRVIQIRAGDAAAHEEFETLVDTYLVALGHGGDPYAREARENTAAGFLATARIDGVAGETPEEGTDADGPLPLPAGTFAPVKSVQVGAAVADGDPRLSPPDDDLEIPAFLDRRKAIAPSQGEPLT